MATQTTGAIAWRPTGNGQGGYYFFTLTTGRILNHNRWTALPMPAEVSDHVHVLACCGVAGLIFTNQLGAPILLNGDGHDDDSDDDASYVPSEGSAKDDDLLVDTENDEHIAGVYDNDGAKGDPDDPDGIEGEVDVGVDNDSIEGEVDGKVDNPNDAEDQVDNGVGNADDQVADDGVEIGENMAEGQVLGGNVEMAEEMDGRYGARIGVYDLRQRRPRDNSHLHAILEKLS